MMAVMFIAMWKSKKSTRKHPDRLMTTFLPTDELHKKQVIELRVLKCDLLFCSVLRIGIVFNFVQI